MPIGFYGIITDRDMDAIVAYLRTLQADQEQGAGPDLSRSRPSRRRFPGAEKPYTEAMMKDTVKHGFYLATIGHCMECHTPMGPKGHDWKDSARGGMEFPGPWGKSVSRNITSSKTKGIGAWTDARDQDRDHHWRRQGRQPAQAADGLRLLRPHDRRDLDDVIAYLRTVPAQE